MPLFSDRRRATLFAVCVASFLEPLATTVVVVSLPQIQRSTGASFTDLQWVVNAYVLTFAALVLTGGTLADRFGRKRIFLVGLWTFILGSLVCGLASVPLMLTLGRATAGIGSAFMLSAGLALLAEDFTSKAERARAFALWGVVVCAGAAFGPLVGGLVTDLVGWRWIFLLNLPICLPLVWLIHARARESRDPFADRVDWIGLLSFTAMFFLVKFALIMGNDRGWNSPLILSMGVGAGVLLLVFVASQLRQRRPMFDLSLFLDRTFSGASIVAVAIAAAFFTLLVYLPLYFQGVLGYSPTLSGLALVPLAAPLLVMEPVMARLAAGMAPRALLPLGLAVIAAGALTIGATAYGGGAAVVYAGIAVAGIGAGMINGELSNVAISAAAPERSGMASGINSTMRQVGFGVGIAGLGAVFGSGLAVSLGAFDEAFIGRVASRDLTAAMAHLPPAARAAAAEAARTALINGLSAISFGAAAVALLGALLSAILIAPQGRMIGAVAPADRAD